MRIISIVNNKGGIGKTTSSINIAAILAETGKTLLIDIDPQSNATSGLGIDPGLLQQSIYNVLIHNASIKSVIQQTSFQNLDICPANITLSQAENELISSMLGRPLKLKQALKPLSAEDYKYVIIDCPPSVGVLTINALMASTDMLIPMEPEFYALQGIKILNKIIAQIREEGEHNINLLGVLITKASITQSLHQEVIEQIRTYFASKLFKTIIKKNVAIGEAAGAGKPVTVYDAQSLGAQCYREFVEQELLPLVSDVKKR
jgi:chromosome partitioning protein